MCACHQSSPLHICISFISFIICNAIAAWHTRTQANTLAKYIDTCEHISSASSFLCANASEKSRICVIKKVDRYERCTLHTYRLAQGNRRTAKTAETTKPTATTANYLCDFCLFVCVCVSFFAFFIINLLSDSLFVLFCALCFFIIQLFYYWHCHPMVFTAYVCYNLLEFYLHTNALFEMQRKQEREWMAFALALCMSVCVCLSVNELNQNDLT